ncbi:FHA domain-containing protein [Nocardia higoensis]|uniref:FHA domain-containing protein n=1 Tax=Nocardia higoensis TaxID=228599 RepID=UPI0002ECB399|nr:FHA domain-containing protein [Nocardia higoensis]
MNTQVEVLAGTHLVARTAGAVLVVAHRESGPPDDDSIAARTMTSLLDIVREVSVGATARRGRAVARLATTWLMSMPEGSEEEAEFGIVTPDGRSVAVLLHGGITAVLADGVRIEVLRGRDAGFTVDRLVSPAPAVGVGLFVDDDSGHTASALPSRGVFALNEGITPGSGAVLWRGEKTEPATARARAADPEGVSADAATIDLRKRGSGRGDSEPGTRIGPTDSGERRQARPVPRPLDNPQARAADPENAELRESEPGTPAPDRAGHPEREPTEREGPRRAVRDSTSADSGPSAIDPDLAETLAPASGRERVAAAQPPGDRGPAAVVKGVECARGHLNDPRVSCCAVCGIRLDPRTDVLVDGVRPPLGVLVLDDGTSYVLDSDCVLGREPEHAGAVSRGARPIRLPDRSGGMSRVHAEIRLVDWDVTVIDRGSANGTHILQPSRPDWVRAAPGHQVVLRPGAQVLIGGRTFGFDSPHGRR